MSDSLWPRGLYSPWNSPGQHTGVGSLSLLQGIFPTQGSNPGLLHCWWILYQLSHQESLCFMLKNLFSFYMINVLSRDFLSLMSNQWEPSQWGFKVSSIAERQHLWTGQCLPGLSEALQVFPHLTCCFSFQARSHLRAFASFFLPRRLFPKTPTCLPSTFFRPFHYSEGTSQGAFPCHLTLESSTPASSSNIYFLTLFILFSLLRLLLSNMGFP